MCYAFGLTAVSPHIQLLGTCPFRKPEVSHELRAIDHKEAGIWRDPHKRHQPFIGGHYRDENYQAECRKLWSAKKCGRYIG